MISMVLFGIDEVRMSDLRTLQFEHLQTKCAVPLDPLISTSSCDPISIGPPLWSIS